MTVSNSKYHVLANFSTPAVRLGRPLIFIMTSEVKKTARTRAAAQTILGMIKSIIIKLLVEQEVTLDITWSAKFFGGTKSGASRAPRKSLSSLGPSFS